jgi:hypothetical protein
MSAHTLAVVETIDYIIEDSPADTLVGRRIVTVPLDITQSHSLLSLVPSPL